MAARARTEAERKVGFGCFPVFLMHCHLRELGEGVDGFAFVVFLLGDFEGRAGVFFGLGDLVQGQAGLAEGAVAEDNGSGGIG